MKRIISFILAAVTALVMLPSVVCVSAEEGDVVSSFSISAERKGRSRIETALDGQWNKGTFDNGFYEIYNGEAVGFTEMVNVPGDMRADGACVVYGTDIVLENLAISDKVFLNIPENTSPQKVYINGAFAGECAPGFSYTELDVTSLAIEGRNELVLLIKETDAGGVAKGLVESVKLTVTGNLRVENVRLQGDIESGQMQINVEVNNFSHSMINDAVEITVYELGTIVDGISSMRKSVGFMSLPLEISADSAAELSGVELRLRDFSKEKYWSCDNPYLYEFVISTKNDTKTVRWGMRDFYVNSAEGYPVFNGEFFFLSGITMDIYGSGEELKPWDKDRTTELFRQVKAKGMTVIKGSGSFPLFWYDLADEMGLLLIEENGISEFSGSFTAEKITETMLSSMGELYNYQSAVLWDLSDNNFDEKTLERIVSTLREYDGQGRPFDLGLSAAPISDNDIIECDFEKMESDEELSWDIETVRNPKIITNFLSDYSGNASAFIEQLRAKHYFSGMFIPYEVVFAERSITGSSLAPVGVAIEFYEKQGGRGQYFNFDVTVMNSTVRDVEGIDVTFVLKDGKNVLFSETKLYDSIKKYGTVGRDIAVRTFDFEIPAYITDGTELVMEAYYTKDGSTVKSTRRITISGGVPYESPFSTLYVAAVVATCVIIVGASAVIAFGALRRHTKKTNAQ